MIINDDLYAALRALGYSGSLNDMMFRHLGSIGYTASISLQDRMAKYGGWKAYVEYMTSAFNPLTFFANGEKGVLLEAADKSTLFQDSAGTTPVTAAGQPVGLWLDKSGRGNHFTQPTAGKRPMYVRFPAGGTRNLLTYTEDFGNAAWAKSTYSVASNTEIAPDGTLSADTVTSSGGNGSVLQLLAVTPSTQYQFSFYAKKGTAADAKYSIYNNTGVANIVAPTSYGVSLSVSEWVRITVPFTTPAGCVSVNVYTHRDTASAGTTHVWGAQVETGSTATAYQKVISSADVTEAGVADVWAVQGDGVDDFMSSAAIDFTSTDKMTVWAGVRKLDNTGRIVAELSVDGNTNNGSFSVVTGNNVGVNGYTSASRGTAVAVVSQIAKADVSGADTAALTLTHDIAGDLSTIRRNGVAGTNGTADKGAGNFGNYPLYLLSRAGTSLFFNGPVSSLIVRGAATDAAGITNGEKWTAQRIGVTLP